MRSDSLGVVGKKLRQIRKEKNCNLKEIAEKSGITVGLLSKIENFRTIPSLPVLHNISLALKVPLSEILRPLDKSSENFAYLLIRKGEGRQEKSSFTEMVTYEHLLNSTRPSHDIKVKLINVAPTTCYVPVSSKNMELVLVVSGLITYTLADEELKVYEGDTLFFDGMSPRMIENPIKDQPAILLNISLSYTDSDVA